MIDKELRVILKPKYCIYMYHKMECDICFAGCDIEMVISQIKALVVERFEKLLKFIDGERIINADTKEEQINSQGKNQAYDIVEKAIIAEMKEKWG